MLKRLLDFNTITPFETKQLEGFPDTHPFGL
jgi:hypothetical protein